VEHILVVKNSTRSPRDISKNLSKIAEASVPVVEKVTLESVPNQYLSLSLNQYLSLSQNQ
jgi:hypothetical protein